MDIENPFELYCSDHKSREATGMLLNALMELRKLKADYESTRAVMEQQLIFLQKHYSDQGAQDPDAGIAIAHLRNDPNKLLKLYIAYNEAKDDQ